MKITFQSAFYVTAFNILLAMLFVVIMGADWNVFWLAPFTIVMGSMGLAVVSLIIIAIVQKPHLEPKIYFFGQLAGTIALIGIPAFMIGYYRFAPEPSDAHILSNMSFLGRDSTEFPESMIAFRQLEAGFENKNDIELQGMLAHEEDTTTRTFVIFFSYNTPGSKKEYLTSKHIISPTTSEMVYYNMPYSKNTELQERQANNRRQLKNTIDSLKASTKQDN